MEFALLIGFTLYESSTSNGGSFFGGDLFELSLIEVTGAAIVEGVIEIIVLLFIFGPVATFEGVVVPPLDDHLREEDQGDGVEGD